MYQWKLLCTIHYARNHNPSQLEAPWYEAWDLVLNEFIRNEEEYSICRSLVVEVGIWVVPSSRAERQGVHTFSVFQTSRR
jgi:hypothetical protein